MATTTSKKEILDYLWEWAESHGSWAKLLVKTIIEKKAVLSNHELEDVYQEFLKNVFSSNDNPPVEIERPTLTIEPNELALRSISEITGVNRLAVGQKLDFSQNMTVVYGENASGKTGYSRILKALGFSYEKETKVLCNVYSTDETNQSAKIEYLFNDNPDEFVWDGACRSSDLRGISIFTNNCVNISIDPKRELLITPIGFHLFELVSESLDSLAEIHKSKIESCEKEIAWLENLHKRHGGTYFSKRPERGFFQR